MECYAEIVNKKRKSFIHAMVSLIAPLLFGIVMCILESTVINVKNEFCILNIFYYAAQIFLIFILFKFVVKPIYVWRLKGAVIVFLAMGMFCEVIKNLDVKHTALYSIAVPGLCENMEYAILYIFFSLLLFIICLIKYVYYSYLENKSLDCQN